MTLNGIKDYISFNLKFGSSFEERLTQVSWLNTLREDELISLENDRFVALYRKALTKSTFYSKLYQEYGLDQNSVKSIEDLPKLPIIKKSDIRNKENEIYIGSYLKSNGYTSGSSGTPLRVYRSLDSIWTEAAYIQFFRSMNGHSLGQRTLSLRGDLSRGVISRFDKFSNTLYLSSYNLNSKNIKTYVKLISEFSPNAVLAYPSSIYTLVKLIEEFNLSVNIPLTFTSSESLYVFQRDKIEKVLSTKIFDRYGNAERSISLEQNKEGFYNQSKLYSHNEYKKSKVITTNLFDSSFPLIRYEVDDVIQVNHDGKITDIVGRVDDSISLKDGSLIGRMDIAFKGLSGIKYAQIIQKEISKITVHVVAESEWKEKSKNDLVQNLYKLLDEELIKIEVKLVDENQIIKTKANKYKLVLNYLND